MSRGPIVLTGGPGGGKTTLINELAHDPQCTGRIAALPEAISLMRDIYISPREKLFQRVMVHLQMALEDGLKRALEMEDRRLILCHRGSLDPLAYWLDRGWPEDEFYTYTEMCREDLYRRYAAVIHLVTAADGAPDYYKRWPDAHRPETLEQAIRLDRLLEQAWSGHPRYFRLDNDGHNWLAKSSEAKRILQDFVG
ncbi:MAG: AAA family ATPase [Anaerolineales bacterium]|nr:AAA family ATPase [Anaerolineales bacterium]